MINQEKLNEITGKLREDIFQNDDIMWSKELEKLYKDTEIDLIDIIASLHNLLYESVTGSRYNYMFHWCNKIGSDCRDNYFDPDYDPGDL